LGLYLRDGLHGADVGVRPEEDVLQLGLLLVDPLHRQPVGVLLGLPKLLVFKQALSQDGRDNVNISQVAL